MRLKTKHLNNENVPALVGRRLSDPRFAATGAFFCCGVLPLVERPHSHLGLGPSRLDQIVLLANDILVLQGKPRRVERVEHFLLDGIE